MRIGPKKPRSLWKLTISPNGGWPALKLANYLQFRRPVRTTGITGHNPFGRQSSPTAVTHVRFRKSLVCGKFARNAVWDSVEFEIPVVPPAIRRLPSKQGHFPIAGDSPRS